MYKTPERKAFLMRKAVALCLLACFMLSACTKEQSVPDIAQAEIVMETPKAERKYPSGDLSPLEIERGNFEIANGVLLYPRILSGKNADAINASISENVKTCAESFSDQVFTEYRIEYNDMGLLSLMLFVREADTGVLLSCVPLTYDTASGQLCELPYFFDPNKEGWRDALASAAEEEARSGGTELLHDIAPIEDDRPFYITENSLVIQYRLYEITTYSEGWPEFSVPVARVQDYLAPNSPLKRVMG